MEESKYTIKDVEEKVEELIKDFSPHVTTWDCYWDCPENPDVIRKDAVKCALVCVKYILSIVQSDESAIIVELQFWQAVEKELLNEQGAV